MTGQREVDVSFTALPLDALAAAALEAAADLGASVASLRVHRLRAEHLRVRDEEVESAGESMDLGLAVRVVHQGTWGFAAGVDLTVAEATRLAREAVAVARAARPLNTETVELAPEDPHRLDWSSSYDIDPFSVPTAEKVGRLLELAAAALAQDDVDHVDASVSSVQECTFYADLAGTRGSQQRVRIHAEVQGTRVGPGGGFDTMRTLAPPVGRGWEWLVGGPASGQWDWDGEVARLGELLVETAKASSVEPGNYDLVIDPSNLWLTIHESVGHATELDRALGYEAAYAGTSFATLDQLGSLRYGSPLMHVTGDRTVEHGLATTGMDDEGVRTQQWDLVRDGILVGYQLDRRMARQNGAALGVERSNGCAYADSATHTPMQRMANVSLAAAADGPGTAGLIAGIERGIYVLGDKSWSIDMQRYNFQFTGQRFYEIRSGHITGPLRDVAYQATTTEFWGSLAALGGPSTYVLGGAVNCGKGQPGQVAPVSHGCPAAVFEGVNVLNTVRGVGPMSGVSCAELVERGLAAARAAGADQAVVIAEESGHVDLRWAAGTLTTNGSTVGRELTIVAMVGASYSARSSTVGLPASGSAAELALSVAALAEAAVAAAREATPSQDAARLPAGPADGDFTDGADIPGTGLLVPFAAELGPALTAASAGGTRVYGFARHESVTTWLGTTAGVRRRWVQPEGCVEWNAKGAASGASVWSGQATRDFADVDVPGTLAALEQRLGWCGRRVDLPAGRYDTVLPPSAVADLMITAYWSAAGREAAEGRTVFSRAGGGTRIGEALGPAGLVLRSDPAEPGMEVGDVVATSASSSISSVYDNGLPAPATRWIHDGKLTSLIQTRATAAAAGADPDAPVPSYVHNLVLEQPGADRGLPDLVSGIGHGLLLTSLWYVREVDPQTMLLTGLTRDGVFLVEGGEVVGAVNNFRFNESPVDLLGRLAEIGRSEPTLPREWSDFFVWARMPAVRVPDFHFSTVSPAS